MTNDRADIDVLYVINGIGTGGAERSLVELLEPLQELGVNVSIAYLHEREFGVVNERAIHAPMFHVGPRPSSAIRRVRHLIRQRHPDLINTTIYESDIVGRIAALGLGVPVISSLVNTSYTRSDASNPDVNDIKLRVARLLDGVTARHINSGFHAITQAAKDDNARALKLDENLIEVVPRGRSKSRLGERSAERKQRVRRKLGVTEESPIMLSVGRREHQKGQIHAIEALKVVVERHPTSLLLIAGRDGGASERLDNATTRLGLADNVRFLGHRSDVPDLMVASDLLMFPSLYEGFGGTLIEAMALGLPIVTSDLSVTREVLGDAAVFAERGSATALAAAALQIIDDHDLAKALRRSGERRFQEKYRIDHVAESMAAMYRRFANGGSPSTQL